MKLIVKCTPSKRYYIADEAVKSNDSYSHDNVISNTLTLSVYNYLILLQNAGAELGFFKTKDEAQRGIEYLESLMVMKRLSQ